jgi:SpoVK/Ycf46/Vps4 family AAA+-type ATPase
LAAQMEGFTGADIESVCKKATLSAIVEFQHSPRLTPFVVSRADFLNVLTSDREGGGHPATASERNKLSNLSSGPFLNSRY